MSLLEVQKTWRVFHPYLFSQPQPQLDWRTCFYNSSFFLRLWGEICDPPQTRTLFKMCTWYPVKRNFAHNVQPSERGSHLEPHPPKNKSTITFSPNLLWNSICPPDFLNIIRKLLRRKILELKVVDFECCSQKWRFPVTRIFFTRNFMKSEWNLI